MNKHNLNLIRLSFRAQLIVCRRNYHEITAMLLLAAKRFGFEVGFGHLIIAMLIFIKIL